TRKSGLTKPSPQVGALQLALQLALLTPPKSQSSLSNTLVPLLSVNVSPQRAMWHELVQSLSSPLLRPSSHSSTPWMWPSPQVGIWHCFVQSAPGRLLFMTPRSHCSNLPPVWVPLYFGLKKPSPQLGGVQLALQVRLLPPSSHSSLGFVSGLS